MSQFDKTITLLDSSFAVVGDPIRAFESLSYSDAWEDHGALSLVVEKAEYPSIKLAAWLMVDGRVYENETVFGSDDALTVKITGASLSVLFDRIVITADERLQGRAEERVRYLVNKYAITGSQAVTGLALGADNDFKRAMDITVKRGQTLSDVLFTALPQRGLSFEIVCLCDGSGLQFNVLQGLDRTASQSTNAPVTMSTRAEIEKAQYKRTIMDYRNYAIVCDEQDAPQTVEVDLSYGEPVRAMYVSGKSAMSSGDALGDLMVAVGNSGYIATSTDGINWAQRTSGTTNSLWSINYRNGLFIAGGTGGIVVVSSDGISWSVRNTGSSEMIEGCGYEDGLYFAFDALGVIYASYDTVAWTIAFDGIGVGRIINAVKTKNELLLYGAQYDGLEKLTSQDGITWAKEYVPYSSGNVYCYAFKTLSFGANIVCVGYRNSSPALPLVYVSSDYGSTGTFYLLNTLAGYGFYDAARGNDVIVAVGFNQVSQPGIIAYSIDGITWNNVTPAGSTDWYSIAFDGTKFCALGYGIRNAAISTDGINWTVSARSPATGFITGATFGISSYTGDLYQIGVDALTEAAIVETLDGDVNADLAPVYKVDYNIGDVIDAVDPDHDLVAAKRVLSVEYLIDKTTDLSITPKLGKDALTLRKLIAKEIKNNGI